MVGGLIPGAVVEVEGTALDRSLLSALCGVRVQQRLSLPTLCQLHFVDNAEGRLVDRFAPGTPVRVTVSGQRVALFDGEVTAVEVEHRPDRGRALWVRAYDRLHRLRKAQRLSARVQVDVVDVAGELAASIGYGVQSDWRGPAYERLFQHRQSDFDLLDQLCQAAGLYFTARGDTLHLLTTEGAGAAVATVAGDDLFEARVTVNTDRSAASVSTQAWDPLAAEPRHGKADRARLGRPSGMATGVDSFGLDGARHLVDRALPSDAHADALAQSELDHRAADGVTLWGVAQGRTELRPGQPVDVAGMGGSVDGRFVLTSATHTLDDEHGYITEIDTTPLPHRAHDAPAAMVLGSVLRVDDPDERGRVKVTFPAYGDVESEWLEVMVPAAGAGKGFVALPDVGDRVLVALPQGDPAMGIVLGGLYGPGKPPDSGVHDGAVCRHIWRTPGGQYVTLDDQEKRLRLENSDGSFVELMPDLVRLHAATDLEIDAPGHRVVIRGDAIDFERA